jgi:hypothetical protein
VTSDTLDKDLDKYFMRNGDNDKAKSNLDMELAEYMKKGSGDKK